MSDYANLLRDAIQEAKAKAPLAVDDLIRCASEAAEAVADVTGGAMVLEMAPIDQDPGDKLAYQMQLRKESSEAPPSDLGVYSVSESGYPIHRWYSRSNWEDKPESPAQEYLTRDQLERHFKWMISTADSRLVVLVTYFQQSSSGTAPSAQTPSE